ncbi:hypothetical protein [Pseudomonas sp. PS01300]|uniref:hypothetical protein n=1 Tax=Pseudomonas sp. PS01300 TaxID=2991436 RepID=UPI00249A4744|nr:hypothetical protein [Pseudomonas sp. PS01300]
MKPDTDLASLPEKTLQFAADMTLQDQWEINPSEPRTGLNSQEALQALQAKGFYAATADLRVEIIEV